MHGFAEEIMPKIERSVEYTFAAYAGVKDSEADSLFKESEKKQQSKLNNNLMCLDESTDVDDISKLFLQIVIVVLLIVNVKLVYIIISLVHLIEYFTEYGFKQYMLQVWTRKI